LNLSEGWLDDLLLDLHLLLLKLSLRRRSLLHDLNWNYLHWLLVIRIWDLSCYKLGLRLGD
jgi:hypothetical protein